jgi:SAM-dependent methyltransferase
LSNADKPFSWGLWALVGFVGWIVVMLAIGLPTLTLAAPAAGVLGGWLVGAIVNLLLRLRPRRHTRTVGGTPGPRLSGNRAHWERVYRDQSPGSVSWFEPEPRGSLSMIEGLGLEPDQAIVDVGGGTSRLADELLRRGFSDVTVMDISSRALDLAREGLDGSDQVEWVVGDVRNHDFGRQFALWHDRAVFHFMTEPEDRDAYMETLERSVRPGGHLVVVTFGPDSPPHCSGLPVTRYSPQSLAEALGEVATLESHRYQEHRTPGGAAQQHLYAHLVMRGA